MGVAVDQIRAAIQQQDQARQDQAEALAGHSRWMQAIEAGLSELRGAHDAQLAGHSQWMTALDAAAAELRSSHGSQLADLQRWMAASTQRIASLSSLPVTPSATLQSQGPAATLVSPAQQLARMLDVWTVSQWVAQAPIQSDLPIAVIVPTRNRRRYLETAVESVLAQRHAAWRLIIVDDGSTDDTEAYLATCTDPRIRIVRAGGVGAFAARNIGLDQVDAAVVVHLDDDNILDPGWLRAVAWAFTRWPDTRLLYGARIVEDPAASDVSPSGMMPRLEFPAFDRARLEQANTIDMNVIAHRAGLSEARFDPTLDGSGDWEMLLRLTARHTPLELPVIACLYRSHAPGRISHHASSLDGNRTVRARVHTTRPLRVLSYNALFPLMSETYIEEEMLALEAQGASIAFAAWGRSVSPYPIRQPIFAGLEQGVAAHDPDVVVVHWASHAAGALDALQRAGRPFAVRVHSFDFDPDLLLRIQAHRLCIGIWAFPHQAQQLDFLHPLVPIFTTHAAMPEPAAVRPVIASVSAGLPKKDWPLLFEALDQLPEFERVVIVARSNGLEQVPDDVLRRAAALRHPPIVHVNLPRADVFAILARTAVLLYTLTPEARIGMPMSVIEGLRAGACIVAPDRPEMHDLCGPGLRPYSTAADIVRQVRHVAAGGPAIEAERAANRARALHRFCDPLLGARYHHQLATALTQWRDNQQRA